MFPMTGMMLSGRVRTYLTSPSLERFWKGLTSTFSIPEALLLEKLAERFVFPVFTSSVCPWARSVASKS